MKNSDPILLVEDDRIAVMTFKRALKEIQATNPIYFSADGQAALEFLSDSHNPMPSLILLDLNMPRMNGWEFLEAYHKLNAERNNPAKIIMLTTSPNPDDVQRAKSINEIINITKRTGCYPQRIKKIQS